MVLIDREDQATAPNQIAAELENAFGRLNPPLPVRVVVKDRRFENWLVADTGALEALPGRFEVSEALRGRVESDQADNANALDLLKRAAKNESYGKVDDAQKILEQAEVQRMAQHSRSFRCFLGRLGHPDYCRGSCRPSVRASSVRRCS